MKAIALASLAALVSGPALAASAFDGTWKVDVASVQAPSKPSVFLLRDGTYSCESCAPRFAVKADGLAHPVAGNPYADSVTIRIVDAHTVEETDSKAGKAIFILTMAVSADGRTMTTRLIDNSGIGTAKGTIIRTRETDGPADAHAVSGTWRTTKYEGYSDNTITLTLKMDGDVFSFSEPTGQSYTATLGGPPVPYKGDPGITTVQVARDGPQAVVETDFRDGSVIATNTMRTTDGKTLAITFDDRLRGSTQHFTVTKQ